MTDTLHEQAVKRVMASPDYQSGDIIRHGDFIKICGRNKECAAYTKNKMYNSGQLERVNTRGDCRKPNDRAKWLAKPWRKVDNESIGITQQMIWDSSR